MATQRGQNPFSTVSFPGVWLKIEIQQLFFSSDAKKTSDRRPRTSAANTSSKAFVRRRKWTNYLLSFRVCAFQLADFSAEKWISQNVSSADVCGRLQTRKFFF